MGFQVCLECINQMALLRSWVQIPPGPLFPVVQLRY